MPILPTEQMAIRDKCFHPTGEFVEFEKSQISQSIVSRFEAQVVKFPRRLAIITDSKGMTYDELNRSANSVAHMILNRVGKGQNVVALMFEQGVNSIITTLGALKAGKTYLPLNLNSPSAMMSTLLDGSGAEITLTDEKGLAAAKEVSPRSGIIDITGLDAAGRIDNPNIDIPADSNAYVFYTSGSTGSPKGVFDTHRNVLHNIMRYTNSLHISSSDRLTLIHSPHSSATVSSLFGSLLSGAAVCPLNLRPYKLENIGSWLNCHEITIYHSVPSVFRQWAESECEYTDLRLIRLEGDQMSTRDVDIYKEHFASNCILVNGLGATECGIVRQYFINQKSEVQSTVPIGYDVEDMDVTLIDDAGRSVPINTVGEIVVKSQYLAKGYWRDKRLTEAAFSSEHEEGGQRIYRTGDLARMQPDGCLTYTGRKDSLIKVRGHSVELADVEAALLDVEDVIEAVVVALGDRSEAHRLVAYLVLSRQPGPTPSSIRRALEIRLPQHMIPSTYVTLDSLPLTAEGKVNRRSLPKPGNQRPRLDHEYEAPRTPIEAILARIWGEVLGLDEVGIYDRFLDLGGDSLLAVKTVSRIVRALKIEITLSSLFDAPTISEMAIIIDQYLVALSGPDLQQFLTELESSSESPILDANEAV